MDFRRDRLPPSAEIVSTLPATFQNHSEPIKVRGYTAFVLLKLGIFTPNLTSFLTNILTDPFIDIDRHTFYVLITDLKKISDSNPTALSILTDTGISENSNIKRIFYKIK